MTLLSAQSGKKTHLQCKSGSRDTVAGTFGGLDHATFGF